MNTLPIISPQARDLYSRLLTSWCDALLELQVKEIGSPGLFGGILCPDCSRIHGRSGDAVYPFLSMAHRTGDQRYLEAATRLFDWSDHVTRADGSWVNEPTGQNQWKGITVFGAIALGEALRHHGMLLGEPVRLRWTERFRRAADFLYDFITISTGNINYPISNTAAMAIAGSLLEDQRYTARAQELAQECLAWFTQRDGLIFGEGDQGDRSRVSTHGAYPIDLGYNVEESLPNLVLYALLTQDEGMLDFLTASLQRHLEFLLPDGAWDNSWGTRNYKWTYWGSRTADGCQAAYALMAKHDPRFEAAAIRNAELLLACTHQGLLYGGPHLRIHGDPPCIHHTFCHAKSLTSVLDHVQTAEEASPGRDAAALPRETAYGVREIPDIRTWLVAVGPWRATVTANDWESVPQGHARGGALSLLWHTRVGPLLAAGMTDYRTVEPDNMPPLRGAAVSPAPHLRLSRGDRTYTSINDLNADVRYSFEGDIAEFSVTGRLVDARQSGPTEAGFPFNMGYRFTERSLEITVCVPNPLPSGELRCLFPMVSAQDEPVRWRNSRTVEVLKPGGLVRVSANAPWDPMAGGDVRLFNPVPGFECLPLSITLPHSDAETIITLAVR